MNGYLGLDDLVEQIRPSFYRGTFIDGWTYTWPQGQDASRVEWIEVVW